MRTILLPIIGLFVMGCSNGTAAPSVVDAGMPLALDEADVPCIQWEVMVVRLAESFGRVKSIPGHKEGKHQAYIIPEGWEPFSGGTSPQAWLRRCLRH